MSSSKPQVSDQISVVSSPKVVEQSVVVEYTSAGSNVSDFISDSSTRSPSAHTVGELRRTIGSLETSHKSHALPMTSKPACHRPILLTSKHATAIPGTCKTRTFPTKAASLKDNTFVKVWSEIHYKTCGSCKASTKCCFTALQSLPPMTNWGVFAFVSVAGAIGLW